MKQTKPQMTGLSIGLAVAMFGATSEARKPLVAVLRWSAVGAGLGVVSTHLLQRLDQSADSRRDYRSAKTRYLESLSSAAIRPPVERFEPSPNAASAVDDLSWMEAATETQVHFDEDVFDDEPVPRDEPVAVESATSSPASQVLDPKVAFDAAMADGAWADAFEAYRVGIEQEPPFVPDSADLVRLRQSAMADIFHRMHSGTVRKDVAQLAQSLVDSFPESTEGRTLAQVLGVLRRSAGLCPRCAAPYTGIANACHDCLRGTPEAYQIAWDDDASGKQSPG